MPAEEEEEKRAAIIKMKPWEQHSAVISIPRFNYNAPSSLLRDSLSGFLITCPIKREKSATKEAMFILEKYIGSSNSGSFNSLESPEGNESSKRRKLCTEEINEESTKGVDDETVAISIGDSGCNLVGVTTSSSPIKSANAKKGSALSLVKLTRSGLLLFTFPPNNHLDTVDSVSSIFRSLESGTLRSPLWCNRIFPIQATCDLKKEELATVVEKLVLQFMNDKKNKLGEHVKFAVGYNRRGIEETEMKLLKKTSSDADLFALLDRNKCFSIVAAAVKNAVPDSIVDLNSPEGDLATAMLILQTNASQLSWKFKERLGVLSVLVELLPVSGIPNGSIVAAVSVLPQHMVSTKPRLCVKALVSDTKARSGKR